MVQVIKQCSICMYVLKEKCLRSNICTHSRINPSLATLPCMFWLMEALTRSKSSLIFMFCKSRDFLDVWNCQDLAKCVQTVGGWQDNVIVYTFEGSIKLRSVVSRPCLHMHSGHSSTACRALLQNKLLLFLTWVSRQNTSPLTLPNHTIWPGYGNMKIGSLQFHKLRLHYEIVYETYRKMICHIPQATSYSRLQMWLDGTLLHRWYWAHGIHRL